MIFMIETVTATAWILQCGQFYQNRKTFPTQNKAVGWCVEPQWCGSTVIEFYSETFRKIGLNTLKTGASQCIGRVNQDNILPNPN